MYVTYVQYLLEFKMIALYSPTFRGKCIYRTCLNCMHDYKVILMLQVVNYGKNPELLFG